MSIKIKLEQPNLPKGARLSVSNLGELVNGANTEIDDAIVKAFENLTGTKITDAVDTMYGASIDTSKSQVKETVADPTPVVSADTGTASDTEKGDN
jgi:hypothetical protein